MIVVQRTDGSLANYDRLGCVVAFAMLLTMATMYFINRYIIQSTRSETSSGTSSAATA